MRRPAARRLLEGVVLAVVVTVIGVLVGWVPNPWAAKPKVGFVVRDADAVTVVIASTDPMTGKLSELKTPSAAIAVSVKNNGELPAIVSEARITFKEVRELAPCKAVGGNLEITGNYTYRLPPTVTPGTKAVVPVRFEVEPRRGDRLAIALGSDRMGRLLRVSVELREADSGRFLPVKGEFTLLDPPDWEDLYFCRRPALVEFAAGHRGKADALSPVLRGLT
ncbi:hypothetical protein [Streptomyces sp. NPDC002054]|uniref:hypothetical protein n=1 Tax=Streptomyces sp. NPDC002054 TaxID=3154663 RepID=UPI0033268946